MEDNALEGDVECFDALADLGGGEKGLAFIEANRPKSK